MAEAAEESVHLKKGKENTLTQQQVKRMIDYLSQHTDYKVLTNNEYQLLTPLAQSHLGRWCSPQNYRRFSTENYF